jgi:putative hydrolase of the HAD superfamily
MAVTTHLLLDFFGTLVDYSPSRTDQGYERSFALLRATGTELDYRAFLSLWSEVFFEFDEVAKLTHREFSMVDVGRAFLRRAIESPGDEIIQDFVQTYVAEWNKGVRYFDNLPQMLERLSRSFALGIITNTHDPLLVPGHLERMGVAELFGAVVTSIEVGKRKPSPDIFTHALRAVQVEPECCAYVGDSYEVDYLGAQSASIRGLLIDPQSQAPIPSRDRLGSIFDLEGLVGRRLTSR